MTEILLDLNRCLQSLYKVFKNIIDFKYNIADDNNIFNSDKYLDLMDTATSYNQVSIYREIEKYLYQ